MKIGAVIVAAGKGERLGLNIPKCLVKIHDVPIVVMSAYAFSQSVDIESIVIVAPPAHLSEVRSEMSRFNIAKIHAVVPGGELRQDSVEAGVRALPADVDRVLVHDGARCLVSEAIIGRVAAALRHHEAVLTAIPETDTIHEINTGKAVGGVDRSKFVRAQTPQGFSRELLLQAFHKIVNKDYNITDEVTLIREIVGVNAYIINGEVLNVKITQPEDLKIYDLHLRNKADQIVKGVTMSEVIHTEQGFEIHPDEEEPGLKPHGFRIGEGYDVHRLVSGRDLILGGVKIYHFKGLAGHSDADVLVHAICDALLGAAALGDIGIHFPSDSMVYKNISSLKLLAKVCNSIEGAGYRPVNVDSTLILEEPRMADHIYAMRQNISKALKLDIMAVSVKATTTEQLGFPGRGEGIAAKAVALLKAI